MRVVCFGDSNTYGYDPRSFLGDRYPAEIRWPDRLARETGWTVLNRGRNGREIPRFPPPELVSDLGEAGVLTVMLGSNDLLRHIDFAAEDAAARLEALVAPLPADRLLVVAPPPMVRGGWVREARVPVQSARLGECYAALARRLGAAFADAAGWDIPLSFDGVHFTEEGHRRFAARIRAELEKLDPRQPFGSDHA